jgi:predicted nucleotidyltransferase
MPVSRLDIPLQAVRKLCRHHHIRRLSLFGSVLREDFRPESDVDMLVEFEPGHSPAWDIVRIEEEFSQLFGGHKVDMLNPKYLNRHLKDRILSSAVLQYEANDHER